MTTIEIAAAAGLPGLVLGWLAKHFAHGNGGGKAGSGSRDEIRWQEEMRAMTKGIRDAVLERDKDLAAALDRLAALVHENHQRIQRIELHLVDGEPVRRDRREAR